MENQKAPTDLGTLAVDALGIGSRETITKGLKYLWELVVHSDHAHDLATFCKTSFSRESLKSNLLRAALIGFGLIVLGEVIGRIGFALQPADLMAATWLNQTGVLVRDVGKFIRIIGTLYAACWLAVLIGKAWLAITALRVSSKTADKLRSVAAQLVPDFVFPDSLIKDGEILTRAEAKKHFNSFLAIFIWIVSFGVLTQFDVLFPLDTSINAFGTTVCILIVLFALSIYFGTSHINVAKWFNLFAFVGVFVMLFYNSQAFSYAKSVYAGTASQQMVAKQAALNHVMAGNEETDKQDKKILGTVLYDAIVQVRTTKAKKLDECGERQLNAQRQYVGILMKGHHTYVKIPDCKAESAKVAAAKAAKQTNESAAQIRQAAAQRVMAGRPSKGTPEKKGPDGKVETPAVPSDREILDGVYTNAVEIKNLEGSPQRVTLCQDRLVALHKRVDTYVKKGEGYETIAVPKCNEATPSAGGNRSAGKKPSSVDDLLATVKKAQSEASALLKQ